MLKSCSQIFLKVEDQGLLGHLILGKSRGYTGTLGCSDLGHLMEVGKKYGVWILRDKKLQTSWCLTQGNTFVQSLGANRQFDKESFPYALSPLHKERTICVWT